MNQNKTMKSFLTFLLCIPFLGFAQRKINISKSLIRVNSVATAKAFIKKNENLVDAKIESFSVDDSNSELEKSFFDSKKGTVKTIEENGETIYYKILEKKNDASYRISIMEFDSNKETISEINSLRTFILKGINNGEHKFENLARVYSSHESGKTGGDLGWVNSDTFSKRFEKTVADKRKGQLFTYDEYRQHKHYVIYKSEDSKNAETLTVLKVIKRK